MVSSTEQISCNYFTKNYVVSLILLRAAILYVGVKTKEIFREIKKLMFTMIIICITQAVNSTHHLHRISTTQISAQTDSAQRKHKLSVTM
jgi:hypothetical protein